MTFPPGICLSRLPLVLIISRVIYRYWKHSDTVMKNFSRLTQVDPQQISSRRHFSLTVMLKSCKDG